MSLHNLTPAEGSVKKGKRIARGEGSGKGGTATRGHNGQKSRSGYSKKIGFEGGQMPLQRRVPKFGFKPLNKIVYKPLNLGILQGLVDSSSKTELGLEDFVGAGLAAKKDKVKLLGGGEVSAKVEVSVHKASKSAIEAIEKAGGKVILL
jgi:large subunit ribosomal protein L15